MKHERLINVSADDVRALDELGRNKELGVLGLRMANLALGLLNEQRIRDLSETRLVDNLKLLIELFAKVAQQCLVLTSHISCAIIREASTIGERIGSGGHISTHDWVAITRRTAVNFILTLARKDGVVGVVELTVIAGPR